jgi:lipoprotein-releasing system ATP-binding protein
MNILEAKQIYKSYGPLQVLKGVDLSLRAGEIISIVGKSGSGKSTLLHILGTLDLASNGTLSITDVDMSSLNSKQMAAFRNQHLGFVFQFHHLLNEFTALENVCIPAFIKDRNRKKTIQKATELLDYLGLADRLDHKPNQLSGGEQQRVAVARALINDPEIVLADEPTGNLDSENSEELHQLFFKLKQDMGQSFIIVTHNEELAKMSDRILMMKDGLLKNG